MEVEGRRGEAKKDDENDDDDLGKKMIFVYSAAQKNRLFSRNIKGSQLFKFT